MLNRKFMLLAIFLVGLLAISAVSASDENTDEVTSQEMVIDENLEITQEDTVMTDGAEGTFTELQEMINNAESGSTITLEKDYAYDEGFKTSGISISKDMTIEGKGHILNALNKSRIFDLQVIDFTVNNVKFYNGYSEDNGGAIFASPGGLMCDDFTIEVNNCIFENNTADYGSAIDCQSINIKNSIFSNNVAMTTDGRGSIYVWNNIFAEKCNFINNKATYGGAIYVRGGLNGYNILNCNFTYNTASEDGGAIYSFNDEHLLNITSCIFDSNDAHDDGGAIYCIGVLFVDESKFICNDAIYGGAICFEPESSGTIWGSGYTTYYSYNAIIINSDFMKNNAADGGAIYCYGTSDNISAVNCIFDGNDARSSGGAIYKGSAEYCIFNGNYADDYGGAIYNGVAVNCVFDENYADSSGDAMYDGSAVNCNFTGNEDDSIYETSCENCNFVNTVILSSDVTKYYGGSQKCIVNLTENNEPLANVDVKITLNGKISSVKTDSKGQASIDLNLPVGEYDVTAVYGDISTTSKVTVKSTISTSNATGTYLNSKVSATFLNTDGKALASKQVAFKVGDKTYTATTNSNGVATSNMDLGVGFYVVTAVNPVNGEQKQFNLVINKAKSAIALAATQSNGVTTLTATLTPGSATGNVIFSINGENKTADIKNGKATLSLSGLKAGIYNVTVSYNGDSNLNASTSNNVTFKVDDVYPVLTAKAVTKTYGTSTSLVVYLKDNKGNAIANKDVKVVIGTAVKNIKTDSKGKATMAISYVPGTYNAKITYGTAEATAKITVKKATPKITAKAMTFKKSVKTKKYTVKLNVNQKVKVAIKVNKKTYYAYTTAKGVATFKITKLAKKGKYTATVSSVANKCYNKAKPVNVKIAVK